MRESMTQHVEYASVDHPDHYNAFPFECIEIAEHMNFNMGSALKYIWRCGRKPGVDPVEDLEKAVWYLQREIQRRLQESTPKPVVNVPHQADVYGEK